MQQTQSLTIQKIISDNKPTIKTHANTNFINLKAVLVSIITDTSLKLAQYLQPTKEQISAASDIIISDYSHFCVDDVRLCMLNGLKGLYGEIMRFDVSVICGWLTKYKEEKRIAYTQHNPEPIKTLKDEYRNTLTPELREKLYAAIGKLDQKKISIKQEISKEEEEEFLHGPKKKEIKKLPPNKPSDLEIAAWYSFDLLHKLQEGKYDIIATASTNQIGQRMVWYNGIKYSQDSFCRFYFLELSQNESEQQVFYEYVNQLQKK